MVEERERERENKQEGERDWRRGPKGRGEVLLKIKGSSWWTGHFRDNDAPLCHSKND